MGREKCRAPGAFVVGQCQDAPAGIPSQITTSTRPLIAGRLAAFPMNNKLEVAAASPAAPGGETRREFLHKLGSAAAITAAGSSLVPAAPAVRTAPKSPPATRKVAIVGTIIRKHSH